MHEPAAPLFLLMGALLMTSSHLKAEAYRAFAEIGQMWTKVGAAAGRADVVAHGAELLKAAPDMYHDLHASLNKTANTTASPGFTCYPDNAGVFGDHKSYVVKSRCHRVSRTGALNTLMEPIPRVALGAAMGLHILERAINDNVFNRYMLHPVDSYIVCTSAFGSS